VLAEQSTDRPIRQRLEDELMPRLGQGSEQVGTAHRIRPGRYQDAQTARVDAAQRETETADTCLVQPLQVVDDEADRARLTKLGQQTSDGHGHRQGVDLSTIRLGSLQGNGQRATLWSRKAIDRSLRALVHQFGQPRERQSTIELRRSDGQHPSPSPLSQLIRDFQQTALAEARLADRDRASATVQDIGQDSQRFLAAEQSVLGRRSLAHQVIMRHPARPIEGRHALARGFSRLPGERSRP